MRFYRKCTPKDIAQTHWQFTDIKTETLDSYYNYTVTEAFQDIKKKEIENLSRIQNVYTKKKSGQSKDNNSQDEIQHQQQQQQQQNQRKRQQQQQQTQQQKNKNVSKILKASYSCVRTIRSYVKQQSKSTIYKIHAIVNTTHSQALLRQLKQIGYFVYFIIFKFLLFGYEKIQFLDSGFIDNLNVNKYRNNNNNNSNNNYGDDIKLKRIKRKIYCVNDLTNNNNNNNNNNDENIIKRSIIKNQVIINKTICTIKTLRQNYLNKVKTIFNNYNNKNNNNKFSINIYLFRTLLLLMQKSKRTLQNNNNNVRTIFMNYFLIYKQNKVHIIIKRNVFIIIKKISTLKIFLNNKIKNLIFLQIQNNVNIITLKNLLLFLKLCNNNAEFNKNGIDKNTKYLIKKLISIFYILLAQLWSKLLMLLNIIGKIFFIIIKNLRTTISCQYSDHKNYYLFYKNFIHANLCKYKNKNNKIINNNSNNKKFSIKYSENCGKVHHDDDELKIRAHHHHHHHHHHRHHRQQQQHSTNTSKCISKCVVKMAFTIVLVASVPHISESFHHNIKYSMNVVKTKYGPLRGVVVRSNPTVEAFLGVPYASPPVGSLRFMPPVTPSTWRTTRLADRFSAVCPQAVPVPPSGPEALLEIPRGRLAQLRRLLPLLTNQSEDCLYLNLYVPRTVYPTSSYSGTFSGDDARGSSFGGGGSSSSTINGGGSNSNGKGHHDANYIGHEKPLPTLVYIHGESYEWNSGNPYDGSVLAAHGNIIVVTINFRLGILGFLKTGGKGSAQGNFGLMDLVAGLHWLRENLPAFGGDRDRITIMGHGTGAALANILVVSPVASDLIHRAILLSGSALSPWAIQKDPLFVKRRVAEQTGCHGDLLVDDLAPCLRTKPISELLAVKIDSPRFLPGFAPFIDGTVIVHPSGGAAGPLTLPVGSAIASTSGIELADFPSRELIFGLTTIESYLDLSAQDLEFGFNETRRDRILRTYVRNVYHYHLNEIYAALKNEYTDWEKPIRNPMGSRDASLEFLSDGHTAAPLIRLGYLHSLRGGKSYFLHFRHQSGERDFPQRGGSVRGEDVPFCLGLPISQLFPYNYTKQDIKISSLLIRYISNFVQTGNPNETPTTSVDISHIVHSKSSFLDSSSASLVSSSLLSSSPAVSSTLSEESLSSAASLASPSSSSLVKHVNDQYLSQISSLSISKTSMSSSSLSSSSSLLSSSSSSMISSSLSVLTSPRESTAAYLADPSPLRAAASTKSKRHALISFRIKRKIPKHQVRKHLESNKKFYRKRYPTKYPDSSSSDENSSSIAADQGLPPVNSRIKNHIVNNSSPGGEDDVEDDEDEDEDEEDNDTPNEEDEFDEKDEEEDDTGAASNRDHHSDKEGAEKFDRFDEISVTRLPFWDTYDAINQLYLEMGNKVEIRNHYRGHKLSMWLSLIPQLHSPGDLSELPMRHHHFMEENAEFYDGIIRPQILKRPSFSKVNILQPSAPQTTTTTASSKVNSVRINSGVPATTTECPPNTTIVPTIAATRPQNHQHNGSGPSGIMSGPGSGIINKQDNNNLLRRLATTQYQSYTTALMVTIAVGCFLLLLNILIFAGIYYQREKRANDAKKKEELREAERCSTSPNLEKVGPRNAGGKNSRKSSLQSLSGFNPGSNFGEYSCYDEKLQCKEKHALADICSVELPLKEFKYSSSPVLSSTGSLRRSINVPNSGNIIMYPPSYHNPQQNPHKNVHHILEQQGCSNNGVVTYQQYQKQLHHQQQQQQQQQQQLHSTNSAASTSSVEHCNQSTQSDQPTVQDVGTSVDDSNVHSNGKDDNGNSNEDNEDMISPGIPEPPPPPKSAVPYQGGILRQPGPPTTPGSNKKRVQIQEISV